ncbi:MAG TPA: tetratricopeptide repeat protein [Kofleriaceae bacterium]|nr:tetratricopeptide repeat protein [Kofleriaceae bacterium]
MDRIKALEDFIAQSPSDPFPRYGLALELATQGRTEEAIAAFAALMDTFPDYVAAYLMAGNTLARAGRRSEAAEAYQRGVEVAGKAGDSHARSELQGALAELDQDE